MQVEVSATICSVLTSSKRDDAEKIKSYLYAHSELVDAYIDDNYRRNYYIIKTTATHEVTLPETEGEKLNFVAKAPWGRTLQFATHQVERFASGLIAGELAGSHREAESLLARSILKERA